MEVKEIGGHQEMCGGWSYVYEVKFSKENITVKEALEEIAEWRAKTLQMQERQVMHIRQQSMD